MAVRPLSKTKIVSHIAEKCGTPKKTAALFFEELFKLAVKEAKGGAGKFVIPGIGRAVKVHRKARSGRGPGRSKYTIVAKKSKRNSRSDKALSALAKVYEF